MPSSRKRRPDDRPAEIIAAALELFAERGFAATRLEDVAARAGLSKAAIYLYFDDKTSLLKAVVKETVGARIAQVAAVVGHLDGDVAPVLRRFLTTVAHGVRDTRLPDIIKLVIAESRAHPQIGQFYLDEVIGAALPMLQGLIERGVARGEFRPVDARLAAKSLIGPMLLAALWKSVFQPIGADPIDVEALAAQHADLVLHGLVPRVS